MSFLNFKKAVQKQFDKLCEESQLFVTEVNKDELWQIYLDSFPPGTNEVFREKREYDCNCCKSFIRACGNVVAIDKKGNLKTIWDVKVDHPYTPVAEALSKYIKSQKVWATYLSKFKKLGTHYNFDNETDTKWEHFSFILPDKYVHSGRASIEAALGVIRGNYDVLKNSINKISKDSIDTVLELIDQKSLYRGEEYIGMLKEFKKVHTDISKFSGNLENYLWRYSANVPAAISRIKNSAIGTLLQDITEGKDLEHAVSAFESIMAPQNYKRPNPVITKAMIKRAQEKVKELGLVDSLPRRYSVLDDITINNVLFANRDVKKALDVFDELETQTGNINPKKFNKVAEVGVDKFLQDILPKADSVELLFENKHVGNLVSLVSPVNKQAPSLFKWDNNFCWNYRGDVADSIKQAVKTQGGNVTGVLRFSIMWAEGDKSDNSDLDAHAKFKGGHIFFSNKHHVASGGSLDIDIMDPETYSHKNIVENITWPSKSRMPKGTYRFTVHGFSIQGNKGFSAEIEMDGEIYPFHYDRPVKYSEHVEVARVEFDGKNFTMKPTLSTEPKSKLEWGIPTNTFQKVNVIMHSPNHWDENNIGNKHLFFMLDNCKNPEKSRGFFNEYLKPELNDHRKVFEVLGAKMNAEYSDDQLSGLGFSSTKRESVIVKVSGQITRQLKVNF